MLAENGETRVGKFLGQQPDEFGKIFGRPAFVLPAGAGLKRNPFRSSEFGIRNSELVKPFAFYFGGDLRAFRQPLEIVVNRHAELRQHGQIPVHGVRVKRRAADGEVVKAARAFADFVQADEKFPVGEPGERAAAREALEVNHQIEILFAQPADAAEHFRPVPGRRPALAFKADDAGQVGIAFEQRARGGINPPENFAARADAV